MFESLKEKWGADFVLKKELSRFSGGILNERSFYNLGSTPKSKKCGTKSIYRVSDIIEWLNEQEITRIDK